MDTNNSCAACAVRDRAVCGALSEADLRALNALGRRARLSRGETLVWAGDPGIVCGNLIRGVLKLTMTTPDGREAIVGLLYPADFVGRPFAEMAEVTISALTDAELCVFPRTAFERMLTDHSGMERLLLERTLAALDEARRRMVTLGRQSAEERLSGFLADMSRHVASAACRPSRGMPLTFDLPLTRGEIADLLGLTIETVSRQMTRLKSAGLIALPGGRAVTIRDRAALEARVAA